MLEPIRELLENKRIVFASGSGSRIQVAKDMGLGSIFEFRKSNFKEDLKLKDYETYEDYVIATALGKADDVEKSMINDPHPPDVVIAADTMVKVDGKLYGKPKTDEQAREMLESLSDKTNDVLTGTVMKFRGKDTVKFCETTTVYFGKITEDQINEYLKTKEYKNFAGAYAIQGRLGTLIEKIKGDYFSILGFPVNAICKRLYDHYHKRP